MYESLDVRVVLVDRSKGIPLQLEPVSYLQRHPDIQKSDGCTMHGGICSGF